MNVADPDVRGRRKFITFVIQFFCVFPHLEFWAAQNVDDVISVLLHRQ